jgi:hypothetical protein
MLSLLRSRTIYASTFFSAALSGASSELQSRLASNVGAGDLKRLAPIPENDYERKVRP